jgi:hypothetical protein
MKNLFIIIGINIFILSWIFYIYLPISFTLFILILHYISFLLITKDLIKFKKEYILIFGFFILIISILLDFLIYNPFHSLNLSLFYYININLSHILILTLFIVFLEKNLSLYFINLIISIINLIILFIIVDLIWIPFILSISYLILFIYLLYRREKKIFTFLNNK